MPQRGLSSMPIALKDIVREGKEGVYHCHSRCVRRAFLCGEDSYSGKNYEHRRTWIQALAVVGRFVLH